MTIKTFSYTKILFISLIFFNFNTNLQSQNINLSDILDKKKFEEWKNYLESENNSDSIYLKLNEINVLARFKNNSASAWYFLDKFYAKIPDKIDWVKEIFNFHYHFMLTQLPDSNNIDFYHQYAKQNAPSEDAFVCVIKIAANPINMSRWDKVIEIIEYYRPYFPAKQIAFDKLKEICKRPTEGLKIRNLGENINTTGSEWDPNPTPDGKFLYFTGERSGGFGGADIWVSEKQNGNWQKAQNLGRKVNGKNNETIDNVTVDGTGLMLSGDFEGTFGNFDIYYIERNDSSWGELKHFPVPINSEYVDEGGYLTADGKAMIFTSDRPGGIGNFVKMGDITHGSAMGNMDIYVTLKTDDGWSEPINLGPKINTPYSERSPYLHPDGKTLYFSSNGHPGLGGLDLFVSHRLSDSSWTDWSEPYNLGKEINTISDDWGYKIGLTGDSAVFAALNRTIGFGSWDIFSVSLPKDAKPEQVFTITGFVRDGNGRAIQAEIKWEDLSNGENLGMAKSNPKDGSYFIVLPLGKQYGYYAEKKGFFPISNNVDLTEVKAGDNIRVDIEMLTAKQIKNENKSIVVKNIFFDFDKAELKKESFPELNRLAKFLIENPEIKIEIAGHTDKQGSESYNLKLSKNRAEAVKQYLQEHKIDSKRLKAMGYGNSKPIAKEDNEDAKQLNRRVEISVK